jgi:photosystem II stability/assembly factor-like uncharacterized protein
MNSKITLVFLFLIESCFAQPIDNLNSNLDFYQLVDSFNNSSKNNPYLKGNGFNPFKRWENYASSRVFPNGNLVHTSHLYAVEEFEKLYSLLELKYGVGKSSYQNKSLGGNWEAVGPFGDPFQGGQAGRVSFLRIHPTNDQLFYAGTPNGGLWKSIDAGQSWVCLNDFHAVLGCSDLIIDYENPATLYLATGDGTSSDCFSRGIIKSLDGGETWQTTGLSRTSQQQFIIKKMEMNPSNNQEILVASNDGVFLSNDGGANWVQSLNGDLIKDIKYKPNNPSTVYVATKNKFYINSGGGLTQVTSGLPPANQVNKYAIGISPANEDYVYLIASDGSGSVSEDGLLGVFLSTDGGQNFNLQTTSPNLLCQNQSGTAQGGQGYRNCCVFVSPFNANELLVGGINTWRSSDAGINWTLNTQADGQGAPNVHADAFEFTIPPNATDLSSYYIMTDGGIYKKTGTNFVTKNGSMNIAQMYRIGLSKNTNRLVTGHQDMGCFVKNLADEFARMTGNDGTDCLISYHHDSVVISSSQFGNFHFSKNYGNSTQSLQNGLVGNGRWVSPITQNPLDPQKLICGGWNKPYRMSNFLAGNTWVAASSAPLNSNEDILAIEIALTDTSVIYAATEKSIHKTINSGMDWIDVSGGGMPFQQSKLSDLCISNVDKDIAFVCFSSYNAADQKVFGTLNGGASWGNITKTGLPNIPYNTIVSRSINNLNEIYLGGDVGVYYTNDTMTSWILFNSGLPNTSVMDLEISTVDNKLYAATYGRGAWRSDLFTNDVILNIASKLNENEIQIYPNPSEEYFTIEVTKPDDIPRKISIFSLEGKLIYSKGNMEFIDNKFEITIKDLASGIYRLQLYMNDGRTIEKVLFFN